MTPAIDKLLFAAATHFSCGEERKAFLSFVCRGDENLLTRLEELLEIQNDADEFFEFQPKLTKPPQPDSVETDDGIDARIGPYRLIERLGSGGCGVVYFAEQRAPVKRKVALKIIRLGMDTESVIARFAMERDALSRMDHPNIARVLDAGKTASGRPYFAMELVEGEKITDLCDRREMNLRQRLELFIQVCDAIQHAHQKGVIHRDIKPSNILVRHHENRLDPKIIDFGIAKATAEDPDPGKTLTTSGQFIGTPAYMSPEQSAGGSDIDTRSDIYSLGALLCELLTASPPLPLELFADRNPEEIRDLLHAREAELPSARLRKSPPAELKKIATQRGTDPQRLIALITGDLDWIVLKAVDKDRARRYGTANGLAMDVRRYLQEEPVLARPPSRRYLLTKLIRRNRVAFAAASVAFISLVGGLALATWLFLSEREAREDAERARATEASLREDAKAVDKVAQAAVLLRYDETEQADRLLADITVQRVPRSLESANTFMSIANWHLVEGRRELAAARFNILGHVLTSVDQTDWEGISFNLLSVVTAVSLWGQPGEYEEIREQIIQRFANSANPIVAEQVIKCTLLEPANPRILRKLRPLADVMEASLKSPARDNLLAWREFSLALMAYREGNFTDCADWARRSLATASNSQPREVSNQLLLIMIDLHHGKSATAASELREHRARVNRWMEPPFIRINPDGTHWYNEWAVDILLKEAESLLARSGS